MKVTYEALLEKMGAELLKAKQADNVEHFHNHIYSIKTLAEVILAAKDEKQVGIERNVQGQAKDVILNVDEMNNNQAIDDSSIFDF